MDFRQLHTFYHKITIGLLDVLIEHFSINRLSIQSTFKVSQSQYRQQGQKQKTRESVSVKHEELTNTSGAAGIQIVTSYTCITFGFAFD